MSKKVIVSGVTGQFGSFMVDYLLKNTDYEIYGMIRRLSVSNHKNINHLKNNPRFHLFSGDLTDGHSLQKSIEDIKPDYYINAGAQSLVSESWTSPVNTFQTDAVSIIYILEAIRKSVPHCRFVNFGSSEQFGDVLYSPQDIKHPFRSRSPYAASKVAAHQIVKVYRESYGIYAIQPICFNYEGTRRGAEFVTRKITQGVAQIYKSILENKSIIPIELGNINSQRDWSDCEDFVDGIWKMLNQDKYNQNLNPNNPESELYHAYCDKNNIGHTDFGFDNEEEKKRHEVLYNERLRKFWALNVKEYVLSSGETHTIKSFVELAFLEADIKGEWMGCEEHECFWYCSGPKPLPSHGCKLVIINPKFYRPTEVSLLCGDSTPIRQELGWSPKTTFLQLVKKMVKHDISLL